MLPKLADVRISVLGLGYVGLPLAVHLGREFPVVDTPHGRWGTLICFDRQLPETARILALKGAGLIMIPSFGGYADINDALMRARAYENGVWVVFVHPRRVLIVDPRGEVVARNEGASDEVVLATVTVDEAAVTGAMARRRPEIYRELLIAPVP